MHGEPLTRESANVISLPERDLPYEQLLGLSQDRVRRAFKLQMKRTMRIHLTPGEIAMGRILGVFHE